MTMFKYAEEKLLGAIAGLGLLFVLAGVVSNTSYLVFMGAELCAIFVIIVASLPWLLDNE